MVGTASSKLDGARIEVVVDKTMQAVGTMAPDLVLGELVAVQGHGGMKGQLYGLEGKKERGRR